MSSVTLAGNLTARASPDSLKLYPFSSTSLNPLTSSLDRSECGSSDLYQQSCNAEVRAFEKCYNANEGNDKPCLGLLGQYNQCLKDLSQKQLEEWNSTQR